MERAVCHTWTSSVDRDFALACVLVDRSANICYLLLFIKSGDQVYDSHSIGSLMLLLKG